MGDEWNAGEPGSGDAGWEWVELYPIYEAPDEPSAIHVRSLLVSAGIDARIRSAQVPWLDGVIANVVGYWGQVLVPPQDVMAARALLEEFQAEMAEDEGADAGADAGGPEAGRPEEGESEGEEPEEPEKPDKPERP